MTKTIFFMHIPKTAGTSIRHSARAYFGKKRALMLYGNRWRLTSPELRTLFHGAWSEYDVTQKYQLLSNYLFENKVAFFSSHITMDKLSCFVPSQAFTILRDPVTRVISHYHQYLKKYPKISLHEYIETSRFQNVQCRSLNKTPLDQIGIVGLQEQYEETLRRVNRYFQIDLKIARKNTATLVAKIKNQFIKEETLQRIIQLNEKDMELYERARKLFAEQA